MISSLLQLVGLRSQVCYTLTNFRGGGGEQGPLAPPLNTPMLHTPTHTPPTHTPPTHTHTPTYNIL